MKIPLPLLLLFVLLLTRKCIFSSISSSSCKHCMPDVLLAVSRSHLPNNSFYFVWRKNKKRLRKELQRQKAAWNLLTDLTGEKTDQMWERVRDKVRKLIRSPILKLRKRRKQKQKPPGNTALARIRENTERTRDKSHPHHIPFISKAHHKLSCPTFSVIHQRDVSRVQCVISRKSKTCKFMSCLEQK